MQTAKVKRLPRYSWSLGLKAPRFDYGKSSRAVFGFDTEYDSETGELLSVQLFRPGVNIYEPVPRNYRMDYTNLRELVRNYQSPFLVAFFALADISKIADWWNAKISDTGLGMMMAEIGDMTIFDVGTFWSSDRSFSLKKLGDLIGLPKLEYDTSKVDRSCLADPKFKPYAMRDAEICYYGYQEYLRETIWKLFEVDICHFRSSPTISSYIFRRTLNKPIAAPSRLVRSMGLRAYWGGRSEVYHVGEIRGQIVNIDANSEYPRSAISLGGLPDGNEWESGGDWKKYRHGFIEILFAYPKSYRSFYGLPSLHNDRLYWLSSGHSVCTIAELRAALRACPDLTYHVRCVVGYCHGNRHELADYLKLLLAEKDKATGSDRYVYKLLANSVIGKLAQNKRIVKDSEHIKLSALMGVPPDFLPRYNRPRIEVGNSYWPEAASLILGQARAVLFEAMIKIGIDKVLLCSTDSVIYKGEPEQFSIAGVPFEIENIGTHIHIWREKVYALYNSDELVKIAHHALPSRAIMQNGRVNIDLTAESVTVDYREFVKLSKAARGEKFGSVIHRTKTVTLNPSKWET